MLDLGFIFLLGLIGVAFGLRVLDACAARPRHPVETLALALPLGLGGLALGVLAIGETGWLGRSGLLGLLVTAAGLGRWRELAGVLRCHTALVPRPRRLEIPDRIVGLTFGAGLLGTLLTAMTPVTDGDALCYHLQVPKTFLAAGSFGFDPDLHETVYPLVVESLYAVALGMRGPVACRLVQWLFGLGFAFSVTALARPWMGRRAWWAGAVALLVPAVSNGMSAPLNDVALAATCAATLLAWCRWLERPTAGRAVVTGLLAGVAVGVKYPALVWVGVLAASQLALTLRRSGCRRTLGHLIVFGLATVVIGGGWYLRAFGFTGNPVYPFFRHTFGGAGLDVVLESVKRPLDVTPWNLLTALGPMTLEPDRFDSFAHQFGPAFLLFLPGLLLLKAPRRLLGLVSLGLVFLLLCLTQRQSMRFVLAAVGPLSVGVAWVAARCTRREGVTRAVVLASFLAVLGFESVLSLVRARHGLPVVLGREADASYLARREPTFVVGQWMDRALPSTARVIGQDHRGFYLPRPYTMELAHRRRTGLGKVTGPAADLVTKLQQRGYTHLLLCPPVPEDAVEFDPTLGRLLSGWLATHAPIFREDLTDGDGVVRQYAVYALEDSPGSGSLAAAPDANGLPGGRRR